MAITVFSRALGKNINPVNFNSGGEALTALTRRPCRRLDRQPARIHGYICSPAPCALLGVFHDGRFAAFPKVPTMKESGVDAPNFQMWRGIAVPKDTGSGGGEVLAGNHEQKVAASPTMKKYIADNVATEAPIVGADFEKFLADQEKLYRDLLGKPAS